MKRQQQHTIVWIGMIILVYIIQVGITYVHSLPSIAILGYHHILPDDDKETYYPDSMWVNSLSSFEEQMQYLYEEGYQTLSLDDFYAWHQGERLDDGKYVVITFDDGFLSSLTYAEPILKRYGFHGSVFVIGSNIADHPQPFDPSRRQHASPEDMKQATNLKFYSHTYDLHKKKPDFKVNMLDEVELKEDIEKAKADVSIDYVAYPYGKYNDSIQHVLQQLGTKMAFSYNENKKATREDPRYAIPRFNINAYTRMDIFIQMMNAR